MVYQGKGGAALGSCLSSQREPEKSILQLLAIPTSLAHFLALALDALLSPTHPAFLTNLSTLG